MDAARVRKTERTTLHHKPELASYERSVVYEILDEGLYCHLGFVVGRVPVVVPTIYARDGDMVYMHGAPGSRKQVAADESVQMCMTVSILDGIAIARAAIGHNINYRSVMVYGAAHEVTDHDEKLAGLRAITNHVVPGLWEGARPPSEGELAEPAVLRLPLAEASAKLSTGPPYDGDADIASGRWAGNVALRTVAEEAVPVASVPPHTPVPAFVPRGDMGRRI